jgi:hypothetical protein
MLAPVLQDVDERMPYFARRRERAHVVSVRPDGPVAAEHPVDRLGDANPEALNAAPERIGRVRFQEEMDVVSLDTVVEQAEPVPRRIRERSSDRDEDIATPERRHAVPCAQRDVHRTAPVVHCAANMRDASSTRRLPSCAIATPTPSRRRRQLQLAPGVRHLESADIIINLLACQASARPLLQGAERLGPREAGSERLRECSGQVGSH